jgi:hypothetical protein
MSEKWYCLAFGIELGPMSRDDLQMLASRGELLPDSLVREGPSGAWVAARTTAGLFPAGDASVAASRWYYEFLGEVLGPMTLEDLRLLAEKGTLRPDSRVREGARGAWKAASTVAELFKPAAATSSADTDADFEVSAPHFVSRPASASTERAASAKPESKPAAANSPASPADDADFDLGPPASAD